MKIKVKNLSKKFGKLNILKNINLDFSPGNINVLIGPNGAGKTTLLRIIGLLENPTSGEIFYDEKSSLRISSKERLNLRRRIGFVFQNPIVLEGTVYENVVCPLKLRKLKIEKEKIENIISQVGLLNKIKESAKKLSGGEKQRLQFARAIVSNPDLILLDEPTNNLDPISVKKIEEFIFELAKSKKTIIFTTHNLLQARHFADKIFFLKDGEILQTGTIKEVFETPSSLDIAEFSVSENIIFGEISKEGSETYLLTKSGLKLHIISNLISGNVAAIIRPEEILISKTPVLSSARNLFKGKIKKIEDAGGIYKVSVECYGLLLNSYITKHSAISMNLKLDSEVYLIFKATSIHILPLT